MSKDEILDMLDHATHPKRMGKQEALELLGELKADLEGRIEALKEEVGDE